MSVKSISLFFKEGSSDKEYHAQIEEAGGGYVVNFQYGRRGAALQSGTKTASPVDIASAEKIYNKLVSEKTGKGYTPMQSGTPFAGNANAGAQSGMQVQLLNPIEENEVEYYLSHPDWVAQEKFDGERRPVRKVGTAVDGGNRKGLLTGLPQNLVDIEKYIPYDVTMDAEIIGNDLYVFDVTSMKGVDLSIASYDVRLGAMNELKDTLDGIYSRIGIHAAQNQIHVVETAYSEAHKREMFDRVREDGGEGIVFKNIKAAYTPGRPASGGNQVKFKFYEECSVVVDGINPGVRSVSLRINDGDGWFNVGNVTIPPNRNIPNVGDVVEVKYLYAYKGGSLYQPQYKGVRSDIDPSECVVGQLKYKPEPKSSMKL